MGFSFETTFEVDKENVGRLLKELFGATSNTRNGKDILAKRRLRMLFRISIAHANVMPIFLKVCGTFLNPLRLRCM